VQQRVRRTIREVFRIVRPRACELIIRMETCDLEVAWPAESFTEFVNSAEELVVISKLAQQIDDDQQRRFGDRRVGLVKNLSFGSKSIQYFVFGSRFSDHQSYATGMPVFTGKRTQAQAQHCLLDPLANEFDFGTCHLLLSGRENWSKLIEVKLTTSLQASVETIENLTGCEKPQHWHQAIPPFAVAAHLPRDGEGRKTGVPLVWTGADHRFVALQIEIHRSLISTAAISKVEVPLFAQRMGQCFGITNQLPPAFDESDNGDSNLPDAEQPAPQIGPVH